MTGSSAGDRLVVEHSVAETERFQRPVGRLEIQSDASHDARQIADAAHRSGADVVIVRYPNVLVGLFAQLMGMADYEPVYADTLLYWECDLDRRREIRQLSGSLSVATDQSEVVADLVRLTFDRYANHYAANPLLDRGAALDGYIEWATRLVDDGRAVCVSLIDDALDRVGFAVIDTSELVPDIRLAGIMPTFRGRGHYVELIAAAMRYARDGGSDRIAISTQAHNVVVMSTWAKLGWVPTKTMTTVHLVRRGLLN